MALTPEQLKANIDEVGVMVTFDTLMAAVRLRVPELPTPQERRQLANVIHLWETASDPPGMLEQFRVLGPRGFMQRVRDIVSEWSRRRQRPEKLEDLRDALDALSNTVSDEDNGA